MGSGIADYVMHH